MALLQKDLNENIRRIISEINNVDLSEEEIKAAMNRMLGLDEWEKVRTGLLNILYDNDQSLWNETIRYIYFFQSEGYLFDVKTIAALYDCLILCEDLDGNLIWTITIKIKSINYLSDYEPFHDPEVVSEMDRIKKMR